MQKADISNVNSLQGEARQVLPGKEEDCFLCGNMEDRGGYIQAHDKFALTSDIAPLTQGHALFFSLSHIEAFAHLGVGALANAVEVLAAIMDSSAYRDSAPLLMEHGPVPGGRNAAGCVDHAHIHIIPTAGAQTVRDGPLTDRLAESLQHSADRGEAIFRRLGTIEFRELSNLKNLEYIWWAQRPDVIEVFLLQKFERQQLRRIAAEAFGRVDHLTWDVFDEEAAASCLRHLRGTVQCHPIALL